MLKVCFRILQSNMLSKLAIKAKIRFSGIQKASDSDWNDVRILDIANDEGLLNSKNYHENVISF